MISKGIKSTNNPIVVVTIAASEPKKENTENTSAKNKSKFTTEMILP